jgi:RNA polymerase sigma-70 factor (ECF subfamily)
MLGNDADAEDVTQDVFLQVVRKLDTFRGEAELTTWLHRVTVNAALDYRRKAVLRRERPASASLDRLLADGARAVPLRARQPGPERQALAREAQESIKEAVTSLPRWYRDVYVLAEVQGRAYAEVGALLGLRLATVKSRLHRARRILRAALASYFADFEAL